MLYTGNRIESSNLSLSVPGCESFEAVRIARSSLAQRGSSDGEHSADIGVVLRDGLQPRCGSPGMEIEARM